MMLFCATNKKNQRKLSDHLIKISLSLCVVSPNDLRSHSSLCACLKSFADLTVLSLLPYDAFQVDAGSWLAGSQAFRLGCQCCICGVHGNWACADHDLLTGRRDVTAVDDGAEEVERRRSRGGGWRLHLDRRRVRNQTQVQTGNRWEQKADTTT